MNFGAYSVHPSGSERNPTFVKRFDGPLLQYQSNYLFGLAFTGGKSQGYTGNVLESATVGIEGPGIERCHINRGAGDGLHIDGVFHFNIRDSRITRNDGWGIGTSSSTNNEISHLTIDASTRIAGNGSGGVSFDDPKSHDNWIRANIEANSGPGVSVRGTKGRLYLEGKINDNDHSGVYINTGTTVDIIEISGMVMDNNKNPPAGRLGEIKIDGSGTEFNPLNLRSAFFDAPNGLSDDIISVMNKDSVAINVFGCYPRLVGVSNFLRGAGTNNTFLNAFGTKGILASSVFDASGIKYSDRGRKIEDFNTGARVYLGNRESVPHPANGSGDVYADTSTNPPTWKCDDPTDSAWETM